MIHGLCFAFTLLGVLGKHQSRRGMHYTHQQTDGGGSLMQTFCICKWVNLGTPIAVRLNLVKSESPSNIQNSRLKWIWGGCMSAISCTINLSVCGNSLALCWAQSMWIYLANTYSLQGFQNITSSSANFHEICHPLVPPSDFCHIHLGSPDTLIGSLILRLDIQKHGTVLVLFHQPTFFGEKEPPQSEAWTILYLGSLTGWTALKWKPSWILEVSRSL